MARWQWGNLVVLDEWLATGPAQADAVTEAMFQLVGHGDADLGTPVAGFASPLVRSIVVDGIEVVFLRSEQFHALRLISIG